jgi:bacillithiol synthase
MRIDCLRWTEVPQTTSLFRDFAAKHHDLQKFYTSEELSSTPQFRAPEIPADRRARVADVLARQNRAFGTGAATLENIERLRAGAGAIVTGQQVVLFGGQLLAFLKALTAIKLAEQATQAGTPTVPIFWLATEDHDLAEVSALQLLNSKQQVRTARVAPTAIADAQVGSVPLGSTVEEALAAAADALGAGEITQLLRESYRSEATLGQAFGCLYARLFADYGLILIDNSDPELHAIAQPIFTHAAERADELTAALLERSKDLEAAGYHAQVKVTNSSTLLFTQTNGARKAVQRVNGSYASNGERLSAAELSARVRNHPEAFSANALLRPVIQDYLLPTAAYVGGPAEVAYFAQSSVVYEKLLGRVTPVLPRASATVVEAKIANLLAKYGLQVQDCFVRAPELQEQIAKRSLPAELATEFQRARDAKSSVHERLSSALRSLDPTLANAARTSFAKIDYQLTRLERRAAAAHMRRTDEIARHASRLSNALYPHGSLQEREIAGVYFLARYGMGFLRELYDAIQPSCPDHQLLYPES